MFESGEHNPLTDIVVLGLPRSHWSGWSRRSKANYARRVLYVVEWIWEVLWLHHDRRNTV